MELTASRFVDFCRSDWAPACERLARFLTVAIVATYAAGYAAGRILYRWNDRLALAWPTRPAPVLLTPPAWFVMPDGNPLYTGVPVWSHRPTPGQERRIRQPQAAATVTTRPAAIQSPPLDTLTVTQLRSVARQRLGSAARIGGRRIAQARRSDLLGALG